MICNLTKHTRLQDLLARLETSSPGQYDFLYLPLDSETKLCRGYAFVNLNSCEHLLDFYWNWQARHWQRNVL